MCESVLISFQLVYTIFLLQIILPKKITNTNIDIYFSLNIVKKVS